MAVYVQAGNSFTREISQEGSNWKEKVSEGFWGTFCLILFLILGPFSAPIVLAFMFSKHARNENAVEPDPVAWN
jgi:hypothetical protein